MARAPGASRRPASTLTDPVTRHWKMRQPTMNRKNQNCTRAHSLCSLAPLSYLFRCPISLLSTALCCKEASSLSTIRTRSATLRAFYSSAERLSSRSFSCSARDSQADSKIEALDCQLRVSKWSTELRTPAHSIWCQRNVWRGKPIWPLRQPAGHSGPCLPPACSEATGRSLLGWHPDCDGENGRPAAADDFSAWCRRN